MRPHRVVTVPAGMTKPAAPACMRACMQPTNRLTGRHSLVQRGFDRGGYVLLHQLLRTQPKLESTCCANMQSNIFVHSEGLIDLVRVNIDNAATDCFPF